MADKSLVAYEKLEKSKIIAHGSSDLHLNKPDSKLKVNANVINYVRLLIFCSRVDMKARGFPSVGSANVYLSRENTSANIEYLLGKRV